MVDNTSQFGGNADLRRAEQTDAGVARCALCQLYEGQQVPVPGQGMMVIELKESTMPDRSTAPLCQGCRQIFAGVTRELQQISADRPAEIFGQDETPEMGGGNL